MQITNTEVMNLDGALRGMRNPMNSWRKSDSRNMPDGTFHVGTNDLALAEKLCVAGSDHRKFLRHIMVCVDIEAPLYWWKEYDTYKVGTTANSTSTMHRIHAAPITLSDFETTGMTDSSMHLLASTIDYQETLRQQYLSTGDKALWRDLIMLLPSSYLQLRTCTLNYEVIANIYAARRHHKLCEWHVFCDWVASLPYADALILSCTKASDL